MRFTSLIILFLVLCLAGCIWSGVAVADVTPRSLTADETEQVRKLQERMLGDSEIMALILDLQNDPEMQELLNDQSVLNAVTTGDISALTRNPRFMRLLENARVKDIQRRVTE